MFFVHINNSCIAIGSFFLELIMLFLPGMQKKQSISAVEVRLELQQQYNAAESSAMLVTAAQCLKQQYNA